MKYITKFNTVAEYEAAKENLANPNISKIEELHQIQAFYVKPFFCKLTQTDGTVIEIQGSGEINYSMVEQYANTTAKVEIGDMCTYINSGTFIDYVELTNLTISDSVNFIYYNAFKNCAKLVSVKIPNNAEISYSVFDGCTSLPVENNIRYADILAVETTNKNLTTYTIKEGTQFIAPNLFENCTKMTTITIPNSVTRIYGEAFANCTKLSSIVIPNTVKKIDSHAFASCTSLPVENNIRYADTFLAEVIDKTLSSYTIKEGTRFIDMNVFEQCTNLTNITIPNSVIYINAGAFAQCTNLTSVTLGTGLTYLDNEVFYLCTSLTNITSLAMTAPTAAYTFDSLRSTNGTLYVPAGSTGYDEWMSQEEGCLGYYNWTKVEQ